MEAKFFKEFKYKYRHRKYKSVTIILGDESCDLDSAVSAIGYAALMEYESRFQRNRFPGYRDPNPEIPRDIFIPMLDVRRDDIHMKTEFLHLWAKYKFDVADLLLKDDLPSLKKQVQRDPTTKIVLVNHHILSDDYKYLAPYVTTIVDHRPMQPNAKSLYGKNVKWIMKDTASCASIVIDEIKYFDDRVDNYPLFFRWYPALLNILRATVVYDTLNFSSALSRFTDLDLKMAEYLEEYIETENPQDHPSTWSRATKLKGMLEARADVSKCIAFDVLRKDAKRVENIYFAHVPILLKDYMKKVDHLDAMPEVLETYSCETLVMLCSYYPPVKIYEGLRKEFAVFSPDREFVKELIEYLHSWTRPSFILTPKLDNEVENLHAFDVHNMAVTKEHFVVALNSFFESKREITVEMKRNQEKSTAVESKVRVEHNGTAKRNGTEKKKEIVKTPTTVGGPVIAGKKSEDYKKYDLGSEGVQRFGPIVYRQLDWEKHKPFGGEIVVELAEAMKKGLILPNLMKKQKIKEKQEIVAEIEMPEEVMAADESHALEESMTVEVREQKIDEEQETAENLKIATVPQMVEESKAVKELEPKPEKDQKMKEDLKAVVEPQMMDLSTTVEKQIMGEEQKTVEVQKPVAELQDVEVLTTVEEQEQKKGEEILEVAKTEGEPQAAKQYKEATAADIKMVQVLLMLGADKSHVLEESTTAEGKEHKIEEEQETAEKVIEKLKTATEPQTVEESKAVKEQEPKIEKDQQLTEVLKTVAEPPVVDVSKTVEEQIIEEQNTVEVHKTVAESQLTEESTTVEDQEHEHKIGEEREMVGPQTAKQYLKEILGKEATAADIKMVHVLLMLAEDKCHELEESMTAEGQEHKIEEEQETAEKAIEKLKTATEPQMVEESKAVKEQEPKIEKDHQLTEVLKTVAEPPVVDVSKTVEEQIIEEQNTVEVQKTVAESQLVEESTIVEDQEKEHKREMVGRQTAKQYLKEILGKEATAADVKMVQVRLMLGADKSHVLEESTTAEGQEHKIEEEQETSEKAIEKLKTATEPQTVEESKAVKEQEPKIEKDQQLTEVLKTVAEPPVVDVSKTVEEQIIEEQNTVEVHKTVAESQLTEESTTVEDQEHEHKIGEKREMVGPQTAKQYLKEILGKEATAADIKMVHVLLMLAEDKSYELEESMTAEGQEHKIEEEQKTAEKAIEKLKTETEPQTVEESKTVKDQEPKIEKDHQLTEVLKTVAEPPVVDVSKTVKEQIIEEQNTVEVQKTVAEWQLVEESTTVEDQEQEQKREMVGPQTANSKTTTKPRILEEANVVKKQKMVEKQGGVASIEIMEVLDTVAEPHTLEEPKMEEKQARKKEQRMKEKQMAKEQKLEEERTKEDIEMDEILKLVSELDISGEKDKRGRKLPKERIVAVAKEADSVFTRCTEKTIAAMRQEAEREKELAEQKEIEIEREMTMALKEEETEKEKEKVREAEIVRQKEMEIEKEITMALKEEEEEIEKRKARERELEEQEKASRSAELSEHDNLQDPKGDPDEFGSSGF